jgi:serine/threonine kinase 38
LTYQKILDFQSTLQFPPDRNISSEAKDLISKLLCDVSERLSFEDLKMHPFFKTINWDSIKLSDAPIIPRVESDIDAQNFEEFNEIFMTTLPENLPYRNKIRNFFFTTLYCIHIS